MIVDGKKIAEEIIETLQKERKLLPPVLKLGILIGQGDAATQSFVRIKERVAERLKVALVREFITPGARTEDVLRTLERLAKSTDGVIVQLPLPPHIDVGKVLRTLPPSRDVDAVGLLPAVLSPVVAAVEEIAKRYRVVLEGKKALVVGEGRLVGIPAALWLRRSLAKVTVIESEDDLALSAREADIIVLGAGSPGILEPRMVKKGVVIFDAGTSEAEGKLTGDADPACANKAFLFTPVPGGIGPIAVAMIFKNLFTLAARK